jgi:hypothetical protein
MRKIFLFTIVFGLLSLTLAAQTDYSNKDGESYIPKPYIFGAISLMPDGYGAVAERGQVGLYTNSKYLVSDVYVARDNGKKVNDGTENNIQGHDNYFSGVIGPKLGKSSNTYLLVGMDWSELVTSNYTKGTNLFQAVQQGDIRYEFGAGHDCRRSTSPLPTPLRLPVPASFAKAAAMACRDRNSPSGCRRRITNVPAFWGISPCGSLWASSNSMRPSPSLAVRPRRSTRYATRPTFTLRITTVV